MAKMVLPGPSFDERQLLGFQKRQIAFSTKEVSSSSRGDLDVSKEASVLFVPTNDTHARMFLPIMGRFHTARALIMNESEGAGRRLRENGVRTDVFPQALTIPQKLARKANVLPVKIVRKAFDSTSVLTWLEYHYQEKPDVIVCAADWGGFVPEVLTWARLNGIPTICIQEGPQDFSLSRGQKMWRADHPFIQGGVTAEKLNRSHYFLTGNPRLPTFQREPLPESCVAMVNANFTYGVFADWRERWTENVVSALRQEDVEFFLSRHPRDDGDYRGLPIKESSAFSVNEQILSSSIVISRFSQVIYEAMLKGRYVIYYNPHGETEDTIVSSKSPALRVAKNPEELQEALSYLKSHPEEPFEHYPEFLEWHCGPQDGKAVDRCVEGIIAVARGLVERSGKDKFPYF